MASGVSADPVRRRAARKRGRGDALGSRRHREGGLRTPSSLQIPRAKKDPKPGIFQALGRGGCAEANTTHVPAPGSRRWPCRGGALPESAGGKRRRDAAGGTSSPWWRREEEEDARSGMQVGCVPGARGAPSGQEKRLIAANCGFPASRRLLPGEEGKRLPVTEPGRAGADSQGLRRGWGAGGAPGEGWGPCAYVEQKNQGHGRSYGAGRAEGAGGGQSPHLWLGGPGTAKLPVLAGATAPLGLIRLPTAHPAG